SLTGEGKPATALAPSATTSSCSSTTCASAAPTTSTPCEPAATWSGGDCSPAIPEPRPICRNCSPTSYACSGRSTPSPSASGPTSPISASSPATQAGPSRPPSNCSTTPYAYLAPTTSKP